MHTHHSGNTTIYPLNLIMKEAPAARDRDGFLSELHAGRVRVGGRHGNFFTMASDMLRLTPASMWIAPLGWHSPRSTGVVTRSCWRV